MMSSDPSLVPPGTLPTTFIPTTSTGNVGYMVMSYPGRPPMVPAGIPMPGMGMPYMQLGGRDLSQPLYPWQMMSAPPMPQMTAPPPSIQRPYRPPITSNPTITSRPKVAPPVRYLPPQPSGPSVTVFVGNITERAPDQMIRFILATCGHVTSWKRVQGFGFCEFGNPDAGLRAIRILHDYDIEGKKLVVRVDAKTKSILDEYKNEKRKKTGSRSPLQDETVEEDDYIDEEMKQADISARNRIIMIIADYSAEMKSYIPPIVEDQVKAGQEMKMAAPTTSTRQDAAGIKHVDLTDANIEEDRRDLITREIGKFREIMKGEAKRPQHWWRTFRSMIDLYP